MEVEKGSLGDGFYVGFKGQSVIQGDTKAFDSGCRVTGKPSILIMRFCCLESVDLELKTMIPVLLLFSKSKEVYDEEE